MEPFGAQRFGPERFGPERFGPERFGPVGRSVLGRSRSDSHGTANVFQSDKSVEGVFTLL